MKAVKRDSAASRGYNNRWREAREAFLRAHPMCAECARQGLTVPATIVDHIKPHKGDRNLFWDRANWQPLCKTCHDQKTAREDGAFGREPRGPIGCDVTGMPVDPAHPWNQALGLR